MMAGRRSRSFVVATKTRTPMRLSGTLPPPSPQFGPFIEPRDRRRQRRDGCYARRHHAFTVSLREFLQILPADIDDES